MRVTRIRLLPSPLAQVCTQRSRADEGLAPTQEHWPVLRTVSPQHLSPFPLSSPPLQPPSRTGLWGSRTLKKGEPLRRWGLLWEEEGLERALKSQLHPIGRRQDGEGGGVKSSGGRFALLPLVTVTMVIQGRRW